MKVKASLEVQIAAAERAINSYASNIAAFESGALTPEVGELLANRLLLTRKRKQLAMLKGQRIAVNAARAANFYSMSKL